MQGEVVSFVVKEDAGRRFWRESDTTRQGEELGVESKRVVADFQA